MTHSERLKCYKNLIDKDIAEYSKQLLERTEKEYGGYSKETLEAFTSVLARGGKRIRGALTIASYELSGGTDRQMIVQAARAVEMIHAYVLMIDDIADRSPARRGGPSAHIIMQNYHNTYNLRGDNKHFGESMATQAALIGGYLAELVIDDLSVSAEIKLAVLKNLHQNLVRTGHGQLRDILNETLPEITEDDALWTATYKTAYYTVINPLEIGGAFAKVSKDDLKVLRNFGLHAGIGFQIADDILGMFGDDSITGKSSLDDLKEGKVTLLMTHTLTNANKDQHRQIMQMLGNSNVTDKDLKRCQRIITDVGALEYAQKKAKSLGAKARKSLTVPSNLQPEFLDFLKFATRKFIERKA